MAQMESPDGSLFRYRRIARTLRDRIAQGGYPNDRIPSERQLMAEFGVQRDTVRHALEHLVAEGVLLRDSTRGTRVAPGFRSAPTVGGMLLVIRTFSDTTAPSAVFRGLARRLDEENLPTYWHDPGDKGTAWDGAGPDDFLPPLDTLRQRGIRGLVVWPQIPAMVAPYRRLRDALPLVLIDRLLPGFETDFVGFEDVAGGRTVTEHLLSLGHRRIGFLSGEPQASAIHRRLAGYADALRTVGIDPDLPRLVHHQEGGSRCLSTETVAGFLRAGGDPLTAVVCANDLVAAHLIRFARGLGMRVPEDLAVTGFGDLLPSLLDAFGITTVAQPFEELGRTAGDVLLHRIASPNDVPLPFREIELPMRLIVRQSCGAPIPR
ncbi:MAG: GntR family transcriptional regulator [Capsulimonadales bacterium]|nr:GntR family transcriptional regulator [Capsulimonadales bacterium]